MDGVDPALVIGPSTDVIAGNGKILTAGAVDSHVHLVTPTLVDVALGTDITTIVSGATVPSEGPQDTTVKPGPRTNPFLHRATHGETLILSLPRNRQTRSGRGLHNP